MESVTHIATTRGELLQGFSVTLNFQANSLDTGSFQSRHKGTISRVEISNINSYTFSRNGSSVVLPFSVSEDDIVSITITRTNPIAASSIKSIAPSHNQSDIQRTVFSTDTGTGRYLYCLNHRDQAVSVIDTDTDTVIATVTPPAGNDWFAMCYRITNQSIYLFGKSGSATPVCRIDADPASGTFNSVFSLTDVLNSKTDIFVLGFNTIRSVVYDYVSDLIYFCDTAANAGRFDPTAGTGSNNNGVTALGTASLFFNESNNNLISPEGSYLFGLRTDINKKSIYRRNPSSLGVTGIYNKKNGLSYVCGNNLTVLNNELTTIASLSTGSNWGDLAVGLDYDLLMLAHSFDGKNWIVNTATNGLIGSWARGNLGVNETRARGCVYSPYSKKFYVQASSESNVDGINRVHIYNPQLWINDGSNPANLAIMDEGFITVGDMHAVSGSGVNNYDQMCANVLL